MSTPADPRDPWASAPRAERAGRPRILNVPPDVWDIRDRIYQPTLRALPPELDSRAEVPTVLDQGAEGACTGYALAAVVNLLLHRQNKNRKRILVSPRFLYENAKRYDEWKGEDYEGSSIRGALKGFLKHGACREEDLPGGALHGPLPLDAYEKADAQALGSYYRVPTSSIPDLQAALSEVGALVVSAETHEGWDVPSTSRNIPDIQWTGKEARQGGHAFALVGYDNRGFIIQNSWGANWGRAGFARLLYEDWLAHRQDAWVLQLSACRVAHVSPGTRPTPATATTITRLGELRSHAFALEDGAWSHHGDLATHAERDFPDLVNRLRTWGRGTPIQLALFAQDVLDSEREAAHEAYASVVHFLPKGLWPLHLVWQQGFRDEMAGLFQRRAPGQPTSVSCRAAVDTALEQQVRRPGRAFWRDVKLQAERAVWGIDGKGGPVAQLLETLHESGLPIRLHLVGLGAGAILHSQLLAWMRKHKAPVESVSFLAPALSLPDFKRLALPVLKAPEGPRFALQTLSEEAEQADRCSDHYHRSLLHLVARALEESQPMPMLGLARDLARTEGALKEYLAPRTTLLSPAPTGGSPLEAFPRDPRVLDTVERWILKGK